MAALGMPAQITLADVRNLKVASCGGRFTFIGFLGSGAFGSVFLAQDRDSFAKKMAIKICCTGKADLTSVSLQPHLEEAKVLEAVHSNEVIAVEGWYVFQAGSPKHTAVAIVTEYCSRGNLNDYLVQVLRDNATVTDLNQMKFMRQVASGLAAIHKAKIVHRDIKPANILLTESLDVKIADLGIAKATWDISPQLNQDPRSDGYKLYMMTRAGTPAFTAPEIYSDQPYTEAVDIFSAGLVFVCITCPGAFWHHTSRVVNPLVDGTPYGKLIAGRPRRGAERPTDTLRIRTSLPDFPLIHMAPLIDKMLNEKASERPTMEALNSLLHEAVQELELQRAGQSMGVYGVAKQCAYKQFSA